MRGKHAAKRVAANQGADTSASWSGPTHTPNMSTRRQTAAEADAKQAEVRGKHAARRLAEQRKAAAGKAREAAALAKDLAAAEDVVAACANRCDVRRPQRPCAAELCKLGQYVFL